MHILLLDLRRHSVMDNKKHQKAVLKRVLMKVNIKTFQNCHNMRQYELMSRFLMGLIICYLNRFFEFLCKLEIKLIKKKHKLVLSFINIEIDFSWIQIL